MGTAASVRAGTGTPTAAPGATPSTMSTAITPRIAVGAEAVLGGGAVVVEVRAANRVGTHSRMRRASACSMPLKVQSTRRR